LDPEEPDRPDICCAAANTRVNTPEQATRVSVTPERYLRDTRAHHAERARGSDGQVYDASSYERTAIVHAAADGVAVIGDGHHASHGTRPVCTGHPAGRSATAIVGGETTFGMCASDG